MSRVYDLRDWTAPRKGFTVYKQVENISRLCVQMRTWQVSVMIVDKYLTSVGRLMMSIY